MVRTRVAASKAQEQIPWDVTGPHPGAVERGGRGVGCDEVINIAVLEAFIAGFKDTFFAELARAWTS
jgi:hypothetical protein